MAGQTIFENPIIVNSDDFCTVETNSSSKIVKPRLKDVFRNIVTREDAEILVKRAISRDAELVDYHLRPFSEEKLGFLGTHLSLVVTWKGPGYNECQKLSFFVKTVPYDVPSQANYVQEKNCFQKETDFFNYLVPLLTESCNIESWSPTCYLAKKDALIFEDLKSKGFVNRSKTFDEETARSAVACLARFHASSLLAEGRLKGKRLNELYPELVKESEFKRVGRSYTWFSKGVDFGIYLGNKLGLDTSYVREACDRIFDICEPSKNKRNVISHGDLWSSNLLFDGENRCNLVDFQLTRYSPLAHDVMQLLYLTTTREFRKKYERKLLDLYYLTLKENLIDNKFKGVIPPFEEVLEGAKEQRFPALVTATIFFPTVLMNGKMAATIMDNSATYDAYCFEDRTPFVTEVMAKDPEYKKRIEDTVRELVEMSLIVDSLPRPS